MTKKKNQHVVKRDDKWGVLREGNKPVSALYPTQSDAQKAAKEIAKKERSEVIIHGKDGRIRAKDSYGNDPHPPKG